MAIFSLCALLDINLSAFITFFQSDFAMFSVSVCHLATSETLFYRFIFLTLFISFLKSWSSRCSFSLITLSLETGRPASIQRSLER